MAIALRVAVLGAIGFVLFAVVFFRLWYLQVLSGGRFVAAANANRVRDVPIAAPRGDIVDRHGVDLVRTRRAAVVQIVPSSLPPAVRAQAEGYREALAHTARAVPIPPLPASGESTGLVPDRGWRTRGYRAYLACVRKAGLTAGSAAALRGCGGIDKPWTPGDDANLAVGQGDLQATPLQLAVAYAAIANGGTVVRPHLGRAIEDGDGAKLQDLDFAPRRRVHLDAGARQVVLDGLRRAAGEQGGTSADVFAGWPTRYRVYGKTGTAERGPNPDQAWYACFVNDPKRPLVVVVTVEKGGFGAATAAPAARQILAKWFGVADHAFHTGAPARRSEPRPPDRLVALPRWPK